MSESQYGPSQWSLQDSFPMYVAEFVGTLMYTMTIGIVKSNPELHKKIESSDYSLEPVVLPLAVGFILVSMVYAFGHISGAHFNPAVTLSVWIRGFISPNDAILFVFIQCIGAICGGFLAYLITDDWPSIEPHDGVNDIRAFTAELIYTFTLCIVVINVATTESQRGNFFYGVAIGLALSVGTATVGTISGGAFNPAIGTALTITKVIGGGTGKYIWIYWVAPLLGGLLGGGSFYLINRKEAQHKQYGDQY